MRKSRPHLLSVLALLAVLSLPGCASGGAPTATTDFHNHPGFCSQADFDTYKNVQAVRAGLVQAQADFGSDSRASAYIATAKASYNVLSDAYDSYHRALHDGGVAAAPCSTSPAVLKVVLDPLVLTRAQNDLAALVAAFSKTKTKKGA